MMPRLVAERIMAEMDKLPPGMRRVGRYISDNPDDVALLSMREQARRAEVPPAAMTRFAQRLGFSGYDEMRALFAASLRGRVSDFGGRAGALLARREQLGEAALVEDLAHQLSDRVAALQDPSRLQAMVDATRLLAKAHRIFCLGHRSCYAPAYHFAYVVGLYGCSTRLLDAPGGIGADALNDAGANDVLLAISFNPYTRATVEIATAAQDQGVTVVSVTDTPLSPLARLATQTILVPTDIGDAAYVTAPVFATIEILATLVGGRRGASGRRFLDRVESELSRRAVYWAGSDVGRRT